MTPQRRFALPGGKIDVASPLEWTRAMLRGAHLFGSSYKHLMQAARSGDRTTLHGAERTWCAEATTAIDLTIDVHGLDHVDPSRRYLVAPLHEGFLDLVALAHLPLDMAYTAADELFTWEHLGPYLTASGQTSIPQRNGTAAYRSLITAGHTAAVRGESLVVFPQGSVLGIEVAFHQGAFRLAERFDLPLLPVILTGAASVWDYPFSTDLTFGGTIRLEVLPPIEAQDAVASAAAIEWEMKERALASNPGPRRFDPDRDGWWDDYRYGIDPRFPDLLAALEKHRETTAVHNS